MSDQDAKPKIPGEWYGLGLCAVGLVPFVMVATALWKGEGPAEVDPTFTAQVAGRIGRALGNVPSLLLFGGMSGVGGAMFLGYPVRNPGRHLFGIVGLCLGVATILGAVQGVGGGVLGDALGGALGPVLGGLVGLLIIASTVVIAYLGGKIPMPKKLGKGATLSTALTELDDSGVSNAESSALAADASTLAYMEELWKGPENSIQVHPLPASPYPEDVRLKGEVPEGAVAISKSTPQTESEDVQQQAATESEKAAPIKGGPGEGVSSHWERSKTKSSTQLTPDSDLGTDDVAHADAANVNDPFGAIIPAESLSKVESKALDCGMPLPELPPGVRPLETHKPKAVESVEPSPQASSPASPVWERAKERAAEEAIEEVDEVAESMELDIVMDLPELSSEVMESEELEDSPVEPEASAPESASEGMIWENPKVESTGVTPTAQDPFVGEMTAQQTADVMAELADAEETVLNQIEDLEEELEREMDKIRQLEARTQAASKAQDAEVDKALEFVVIDEPSLFEDAAEADETEAEVEESEEGELEEGEEYEDEAELEEGEEYEEEEEEEEEEGEEGELEEGEEYEYEEEGEEGEEEPTAELEEGEEYEEGEEEEEEEEGEYEEEELAEGEEYEEVEEGEEEPVAAELEEGEEEEYEYEEGEEEEGEEEEGEEEEGAAAELEEGEEEEEYEEYEYEEFEEEDDSEEEEAEYEEEPEVEIQPAPSGRKSKGRDPKWSHSDLVREAGVFLIERDRVGVSLLQRQFELEFEDAQALLDEIEEAGLIEPYMGGQKRAILLDLEAWMDITSAS